MFDSFLLKYFYQYLPYLMNYWWFDLVPSLTSEEEEVHLFCFTHMTHSSLNSMCSFQWLTFVITFISYNLPLKHLLHSHMAYSYLKTYFQSGLSPIWASNFYLLYTKCYQLEYMALYRFHLYFSFFNFLLKNYYENL